MDKQLEKVIKSYFGELEGETTDDFYDLYCKWCEMDGVKPRAKNVVIREACDSCGLGTRAVVHREFCEKAGG